MNLTNIFYNLLLDSAIPVWILFFIERCSLYYLKQTQTRYEWVRSQFWLHPNFISRCRYPMGVISVLMYHYGFEKLSIIWFGFWMITDLTDGTIARYFNLHTLEGEIIDPLSDKLLYFPPIIYFGCYGGMFYTPIIVVFLVFDVIGQFSRFFIADKSANLFGKAKTFLAVVALTLAATDHYYLEPYGFSLYNGIWSIPNLLLYATTFLAFFSMFFKIVPNYWYANILTFLNFFCGVSGIILIFTGYPAGIAFLLVFLGQFLDLFDGRAAELWGSTPQGELFDDIADGTNFGGTIACIIYASFKNHLLGILLGLIYFSSTIFRLVRFIFEKRAAAIQYGVKIFAGLPSPAAAMFVGASILLFNDLNMKIISIILISGLMISRIPYIHFGRVILPLIPKLIRVLILTFIIISILVSWRLRSSDIIISIILLISISYLIFGYVLAKKFQKITASNLN